MRNYRELSVVGCQGDSKIGSSISVGEAVTKTPKLAVPDNWFP
jgi:hypothetical protein